MTLRILTPGVSVAILLLAACNEPEPTTSPAPVGSATQPIAPSAPKPMPQPAPAPSAAKQSADTWLVVQKGGVELGLVELRSGKAPKLTRETQNEDFTALKAKLDAIGGPGGIGLDMHLPPPSGQGRGPSGTRIVKYDDPLYRHAVKNALEPAGFDVKEVAELTDPHPPERFRELHVSRSGKKIGTLDFRHKPPKLTLHTQESDGRFLKTYWEQIEKLDTVKVRYHHAKDSVQTLHEAQSKPADPSYAQTVALHLIVENDYKARYGFALEFVP